MKDKIQNKIGIFQRKTLLGQNESRRRKTFESIEREEEKDEYG